MKLVISQIITIFKIFSYFPFLQPIQWREKLGKPKLNKRNMKMVENKQKTIYEHKVTQ